MPKGNRKGSQFERMICKQLSEWWTHGIEGEPRDDVFWRASQSGGRATGRARLGKTTAGSYGDICALDPIGYPLLSVFTMELKIGKSHGFPGDLIDVHEISKKNKWIRTMSQAIRSHIDASSHYWMIIARQHCRRTMVYFPTSAMLINSPLYHAQKGLIRAPVFRFRFPGRWWGVRLDFIGVPFEKFLDQVSPSKLRLFG